jgi:hypothetical protein
VGETQQAINACYDAKNYGYMSQLNTKLNAGTIILS